MWKAVEKVRARMAQLLISWAVTQFVGDGRKIKKAWAVQLAEKSGQSRLSPDSPLTMDVPGFTPGNRAPRRGESN